MAMTRKHYIMIAQAIKDNTIIERGNGLSGLINDLCIIFKQDNISFDSARFKEYIDS